MKKAEIEEIKNIYNSYKKAYKEQVSSVDQKEAHIESLKKV